MARIEAFAGVRSAAARATVLHGDARTLSLRGPFAGVVTSPPYPGLIDYHEQHRYAYELLGLPRYGADELGRPANGLGRAAISAYVEGVATVLANARGSLARGATAAERVSSRSQCSASHERSWGRRKRPTPAACWRS